MRRLAIAALAVAAAAQPLSASRDGGAQFDLSVAGVPIGEASLSVQTDGETYVVDGAAAFGFLFWGGSGSARAEGATVAGGLRPAAFDMRYRGVTRPGQVEIDFHDGRAVRWSSVPPPSPEFLAERVDVSEADLAGVLDPLSALVIPAAAVGSPEAACQRVLPVFNGVTRFDLALTGAARSAGGVVDCVARYRPVSGHRPGSAGVERLTAPDAVRVSLAPLDGRFWGPSRIAVATRFGTFEMVRRGL